MSAVALHRPGKKREGQGSPPGWAGIGTQQRGAVLLGLLATALAFGPASGQITVFERGDWAVSRLFDPFTDEAVCAAVYVAASEGWVVGYREWPRWPGVLHVLAPRWRRVEVSGVRLRYGESPPGLRRDATDVERVASAVIVNGLDLLIAFGAGRLRVEVSNAAGSRVTVQDIRLDAASGFDAVSRFLRESGQCP